MASINDKGSIVARCPGCRGALSSFEWKNSSAEYGSVKNNFQHHHWRGAVIDYRLFRCAGCGRGGLGSVVYAGNHYPGDYRELRSFFPEAKERLRIPNEVPDGIAKEFREAEACLEANCLRAAAGLFRSVLDKTLRSNGYKEKRGTTLEQQIDQAADDGVITAARRRRAHDEVRVLGNDVLHDDWHLIPEDDVEAARHYTQRILEDFYDDRDSVLTILRAAGRMPVEDHDAPGAS